MGSRRSSVSSPARTAGGVCESWASCVAQFEASMQNSSQAAIQGTRLNPQTVGGRINFHPNLFQPSENQRSASVGGSFVAMQGCWRRHWSVLRSG